MVQGTNPVLRRTEHSTLIIITFEGVAFSDNRSRRIVQRKQKGAVWGPCFEQSVTPVMMCSDLFALLNALKANPGSSLQEATKWDYPCADAVCALCDGIQQASCVPQCIQIIVQPSFRAKFVLFVTHICISAWRFIFARHSYPKIVYRCMTLPCAGLLKSLKHWTKIQRSQLTTFGGCAKSCEVGTLDFPSRSLRFILDPRN